MYYAIYYAKWYYAKITHTKYCFFAIFFDNLNISWIILYDTYFKSTVKDIRNSMKLHGLTYHNHPLLYGKLFVKVVFCE